MMDGPKEILILMVKLLGLIFEVDDDNCWNVIPHYIFRNKGRE
jgi:hypothetical protein